MFKLILGLGNKDIESAKHTALKYSKLGIDLIDSSIEVYRELKDFLKDSNIDLNKTKLGVSVALSGDVHAKKAKINKHCKNCGKCERVCSAGAIALKNEIYRVDYKKCVGCRACKKVCKNDAIDIYELNSFKDDINYIVENELKPDFLELHLSVKKKKEIYESFKYVLDKYRGNISLCLSRRYFGSDKIKKIILNLKEMFDEKCPQYDFVIQADGTSINNANDEYASNLEALAFFQELKSLNLKVIICGGLNHKTVKLCKMFDLKPDGFGFGSFARKIADDDIQAKKLVEDIKNYCDSYKAN